MYWQFATPSTPKPNPDPPTTRPGRTHQPAAARPAGRDEGHVRAAPRPRPADRPPEPTDALTAMVAALGGGRHLCPGRVLRRRLPALASSLPLASPSPPCISATATLPHTGRHVGRAEKQARPGGRAGPAGPGSDGMGAVRAGSRTDLAECLVGPGRARRTGGK